MHKESETTEAMSNAQASELFFHQMKGAAALAFKKLEYSVNHYHEKHIGVIKNV